jgi:tRNA(Ile)-lysidine synthase
VKSSDPDRLDAPASLSQRAALAFALADDSRDIRTLALAVSGGSDSMALLALAADHARTAGNLRLVCVTVDHGLRPEAAEEARAVARASQALGVSHETLTWTRTSKAPAGQAEARRARHALLASWAAGQGIKRIALGHTRDDRLETFLMRARQGSGWYGLAGPMPSSPSPVWPEGDGITLLRPLLSFRREELRDELRARGIGWIEDPSNANDRFERVRMRDLIQLMDAGRCDRVIGMMDRLVMLRAAVMAQAHGLLAELEARSSGEQAIALAVRERVSGEAWRRFIEAMVMTAGGGETAPRTDALARLVERIGRHDPDLDRGATLGGAQIRVRDGAMLTFGRAPPRRGETAAKSAGWDRAGHLLAPPDMRLLGI